MNHHPEWTEAEKATLRSLWAAGHSTAEIGRRMGKTKCAVSTKAHHMGLPRRPSPIKKDGPPAPRTRAKLRKATLARGTLPPLKSCE